MGQNIQTTQYYKCLYIAVKVQSQLLELAVENQ